MDEGFGMFLSLVHVIAVLILHVQQSESESRYCQEAVDSAKSVTSCPTSKAEWDDAARRKNCSSIASKQNCSLAEHFQYHCVINEFRNELLEVCAPSRIIFESCVEFNVAGGVIQDQWSAPCNETFPKCDYGYSSWNAYLYPDCYQLVFNSKMISTTITTTELPSTDTWSIILDVFFWLVAVISWIFTFIIWGRLLFKILASKFKNPTKDSPDTQSLNQNVLQPEIVKLLSNEDACDARSDDGVFLLPDSDVVLYTNQRKEASDNRSEEVSSVQTDSDNMCDPQLPTRNISPAPSSIQSASSGSTIYEDAPNSKSDDANVMRPIFDQRKDASDKKSEELRTVQSDSDNMCDPQFPTRNISPAPSSIQSASSGSTIYEDASETSCNDPDVLQPNCDKKMHPPV